MMSDITYKDTKNAFVQELKQLSVLQLKAVREYIIIFSVKKHKKAV